MERFDPEQVRADFPALTRLVNGHPLAYLDNAASTQKPQAVLETLLEFYRLRASNVHRGIHTLSEEATAAYEAARDKVAAFIGAPDRRGVIFTRNTTEAINLVAYAWGRTYVRPEDRIIVTELEHHSNLLPWQELARATGAELVYVPILCNGQLDLDAFKSLLNDRVKIVACSHVSNVLGTLNPLHEIIAQAHAVGALTLVDAAQSVPHLPVNVQALDCDFLAFSGHKMCAPTGVGVLYGRPEVLDSMPPFLTGGGMIRHVDRFIAVWDEIPWKFEAGTSPVAEAVALGAAIDYLQKIGMGRIWEHEQTLTAYALERLAEIPGITIPGPSASERGGIISFSLPGIHPHDLAHFLDSEGIAVRAGFHCAEVLHNRLGLSGTVRASFYLYNTQAEIDRLVIGILKAHRWFKETVYGNTIS